jgi:YidC/Oxa1 family membrane protein insertase
MDRTSIIVLVVCFLLLVLWYPFLNKVYPPKPMPAGMTNRTASVTGTNQATSPGPGAGSNATAPSPAITPEAADIVTNTNTPEELLVVSNAYAHYTFSSYGGGLKDVDLLQYPETVSRRRELRGRTNAFATLNEAARVPTLAIIGGPAVQGDGIFKLTRLPNGVRAEKTLTNGLSIVKDFQLSTNYLIDATVRLENHSAQSLALPPHELVVGTATPLGARDDGSTVGVMWYNGAKSEDVGGSGYFSRRGFACTARVPPTEYRGGASNVVWAAAHNQFFALALMPPSPAQNIVVRRLDLPRPTGEEAKLVATNAPPPQGYEASLVYPAITVTSNQLVERHIVIYAGPKEYRTVASIADRFNNNLDQIMGFGSWYGFVSKALLLGMNWLHDTLRLSYGWAIVAITFIIKLVFWPFTAASTRSSKRMQALQPQVSAIKEKYKDDPLKTHQKTMELYKKNKVNPMGSCIPMVIQIPVFFGFLAMLRSAIELRGGTWLWAGDLTKPDTLFVIPGLGFIPFIGIAGVGLPFNLLPLIMGATMLWQARLAPPSPGMDPSQQAIMKYLPLIFLVGLYNFSSGLTLYWTVNNLLTVIQTKLTRNIQPISETVHPPATPLTKPQKKKK